MVQEHQDQLDIDEGYGRVIQMSDAVEKRIHPPGRTEDEQQMNVTPASPPLRNIRAREHLMAFVSALGYTGARLGNPSC
jgi:hypothetical protein